MMFKILMGKIVDWLNYKIIQLRSVYYKSQINGTGVIAGNCEIQYAKNIFIDDNSFINGGSRVFASPNAKIIIGKNCMISYNCHLRTSFHYYLDKTLEMNKQGMGEADIIIGDDVWIGYGAQIMSGIKIGNGAVIGAGAIVCHDIEPYSVYADVPAKKIKNRESKDILL